MRIVVKFVFGLGFLMILGAAFVAIDGLATDERRAAVDATIDDLAAENEEKRGRTRRMDIVGRTARMIRDFKNGIFFSAPVSLAEILPPAPEGWQRREYATVDGLTITGEVTPDGQIGLPKTGSILRRFDAASGFGNMATAVTYAKGGRLVSLRLVSSTDTFRTLASKDEKEISQLLSVRGWPKGRPVLGLIDGIAIVHEPQFSTDPAGRPIPVT